MKLKHHQTARLLLIVFAAAIAISAFAVGEYLDSFVAEYPSAPYPNADPTCVLCHAGYPAVRATRSTLNSYGTAYRNGYDFPAIENVDSDGDGFSNIAEITAGFYPGDASSHQSTTTYTVGGNITGLSDTVVLRNNGGDDLSRNANGTFTFGTALAGGSAYNVTIQTQPAGQTCSVANGAGTIGGANVINVSVTCSTLTYTVGGSISGLSGTVVLRNNGGNDLSLSANGPFTFATRLAGGSTYDVAVLTQPVGQTCSVTSGSGTIGTANVANVSVTCSTLTYTVGGNVSGFSSTGTLVLQNNGGGNLSLSANGPFTFATRLAGGSRYDVAVLTQPVGQICSVTSGSGTIGTANVANVSVTCSTLTYTVGGNVSGFSGTGTLVLQNNGGGNLSLSANGPFTFATRLAGGVGYNVTVQNQPTSQICSVTSGSGTIGTANVANVSVTCSTLTYTVGGNVSGFSGTGTLVLQNNGGGNLSLSANGPFTFATRLAGGSTYDVAVLTQPVGQTCSVTSGSGTIGTANITNISVTCSTLTYSVGGNVSGLSGAVVLRNNGGNDLSRNADGAFTFTTALAGGAGYNVTVQNQPAGQTCSVANGVGTIGTANITNVSVTCAALPTYTVGGNVSSLTGTVMLRNNGGGDLSRNADGAFTFATPLRSGATYNVTVQTQPVGQTCSVANGVGTIGTANITNVSVTCAALPTYTVGGNVSSLSGTVVLRNNGGNDLSRNADGAFTFTTALAGGAGYNVTVQNQPAGQTCLVANGVGTIGTANITNVAVSCSSTSTSPVVTITSPTTSSTYTTSTSPLDLAGTASGSLGIASVTWANLSGGSGSAISTNSWSTWSISKVPLQSGINVISVTATDAAGQSGTTTLTVTYNAPDGSGDDLSGMSIWEGNWLKLTITNSGEDRSITTAYLKILSWDSNMRILRTNLYSPGSRRGRWVRAELPFRYSSGSPLGFLFSFDYAGIYGFSGTLSGTKDSSGDLTSASLRAQGLSLSTEGDERDERDDDDERTSDHDGDNVTISGSRVSGDQIPSRLNGDRRSDD